MKRYIKYTLLIDSKTPAYTVIDHLDEKFSLIEKQVDDNRIIEIEG